jgi:cytosine/adenosine deaminase-related metal-dependent hydrolase
LVRETLKLAREEQLSVSSHFLESPEESLWLNEDKGAFLDFFKNFLGQEKAVTKPMEFLNLFSNIKNLSFTHCVEVKDEEIEKIKSLGATINHCVTSNRILNNSKLDLSKLKDIPFSIGTDGLSSNNSLSMFDELRNVLITHWEKNIIDFSKVLLKSATVNPAISMGLNKGVIEKEFDSDMIAFTLPDEIEDKDDLAMQIILHTKFVDKTIIGGEFV